MRVKTSALLRAAALAATLAAAGCGTPETLRPPVQQLALGRVRSGSTLSLASSGGSLLAVFSEWDSGTILVSEIPEGPRLPDAAPPPAVVDRVQAGPALSGSLGLHAAGAFGGSFHVLYLDRRREDHKVLKSLTRPSSARWEIDPVEPPGEPVAVLPDASGSAAAFWAAGSLLWKPLAAGTDPAPLRTPFLPAGPGSAAGSAFTVYDTAARELLLVRPRGTSWSVSPVPGGGPVQCAAVSPSGGPAVAVYDPDSRRIRLLELKPDGGWKSSTVTIARGTRFIYACGRGGSYVFLYDGVEAARGGSPHSCLWLLARSNGQYRRSVVWEGTAPLAGAAACVDGDAAYVLLAQTAEVTLLRVALP
jgi:hypothetical protein